MPRREEEPPCLGAGTGLSARLRKEPLLTSTSGSCCVCSPWPSSGAFNNSKREVKASPLPSTHLVAGGAAGSEELGMVPAAVDPPVLLEVDEVHQGLVAEVAGEAGRVPKLVPQPRRRNPWVPFVQPPTTLQGRGTRGWGPGWLLGMGSPLGNGCRLTFLQGQPWQGPGTGHASPCPSASRLRRALNARSCFLSSSARSGQYRSCTGRRR